MTNGDQWATIGHPLGVYSTPRAYSCPRYQNRKMPGVVTIGYVQWAQLTSLNTLLVWMLILFCCESITSQQQIHIDTKSALFQNFMRAKHSSQARLPCTPRTQYRALEQLTHFGRPSLATCHLSLRLHSLSACMSLFAFVYFFPRIAKHGTQDQQKAFTSIR